MLRDDPDHFGHDSTHRPHPVVTRKWASVRDLDDISARLGRKNDDGTTTIDLAAAGYDKILGGGKVNSAYLVIVPRSTDAAVRKIKDAGGEVRGA